MIELDAVLFEQAIFNILDNAAKYAPVGTRPFVSRVGGTGTLFACKFLMKARAFRPPTSSTFSTSSIGRGKRDQVRAGTGLGLAISRGFVEAMRGTVTAANRADRSGAAFTISWSPRNRYNWIPLHDRRPP